MDNLQRLVLKRDKPNNEYTYGKLYIGSKLICETMEPGILDVNAPRVKPGFYHCVPHGWEEGTRFKYKKTWALIGQDVSHQPKLGVKRAAILFHSGARDEHTLGCVLTGVSRGTSNGEPSLVNAYIGEAMDKMRDIIGNRQFYLTIEEPNGN